MVFRRQEGGCSLTVRRVPPSLPGAVGLAVRALAREPWLLAVGLLVALARRAALWPAWVVAAVVIGRAALLSVARHPVDPTAPVEGVLAALGAPRFVALVAGLWLVGIVLGAALRVAYLAGAFPTLGAAMAGAPGPRFAAGVSFGFPRVLASAGLGFVLDLSGGLFGWTLALAGLGVSAHAAGQGGSTILAGAVALALTLALAVPLALSAVADAAVALAALCAEGPGAAFAGSGGRFLARPGTFLLAALAFGLAGAFAPGAVEAAGGLVTGFAHGVPPLVLLGPHMMLAVLAAAVAAAIDLAWLGTIAALACAEDRR
jgi:hypothetical protein